ncbi:MAG TPA: DUF4147 domain-containing protein [Thermoanaerobaculia bacterium]|nr:DUF4147 domain-containing protein [Thermoanaerobaculia bacterium]
MTNLELLYRETLARCAPESLVRQVVSPDMPRHLVAIGKCAGPLLDGFAAAIPIESAFVVVPRGYPEPRCAGENVVVRSGGHPDMDAGSFAAGEELLRYAAAHEEITFLISGGGSACVEAPLRPFFSENDLAEVNRRLARAGLPIAAMNTVRKHLSAIKGGRLAARVRGRSVTLVYSDVGAGDLASVASGPTLPDDTSRADAIAILRRIGGCDPLVTALGDERVPETVREIGNTTWRLIADNQTLLDAAATVAGQAGWEVVRHPRQIETGVAAAARDLAGHATSLRPREMLIAGGEPTVELRGSGRGGRCLELAVHFAREMPAGGGALRALFASSDGVDGNSGVAGVVMDLPPGAGLEAATADLASSDSLRGAGRLGRPIIIPPTGNNLRDLYLVART